MIPAGPVQTLNNINQFSNEHGKISANSTLKLKIILNFSHFKEYRQQLQCHINVLLNSSYLHGNRAFSATSPIVQ